MKKILNIALASVLMIGVSTSCEEFLEAPAKSTLDESKIFSVYALAKSAVDGIKEPMGQTNSYRGRFLPWYGMNTDIEWNNSSSNADDNYDLVKYSAQPDNDQMNTTNNAWAMMYTGIERANLCIRGLRAYGDIENDPEMAHLLGEALTLRAVYYADLVKSWGDVPASFEPITPETIYLPRSSRDVIYKQLLADLEEAATLVPWPNETSNTATVERVNKAFVKGLRARLALAAGGYSQYGDGVRLSNDPELARADMYAIALQECKDVIESGTAQLESSFEDLWRNFSNDQIEAGRESLWEIPFADGRGRWMFTFAVRHESIDKYTGQARGGQGGPVPHMFYDYDAADTRRDVTCVPYRWKDVSPATDVAQQELTGINEWMFGKYRYEWKSRYVTASNDDGTNYMYMRYAEILLMAAEAAYELEGADAAKPYLKEIRKRAFNSTDWATKVDAYIDGLSGTAVFDAIVEEHKLEFCGEMLRKQALIRWNLLGTKLAEAKAKMYDLRSRSGDYSDVSSILYYRLAADNETLEFYGLERGETDDKSAEYSDNMSWADPGELEDDKVEGLYVGNPDANQYWPIWQVFIDGSNGMLTNELLN
ncbi:RagB/SusD family nutrient uptake outer membrane protein [Marinoscillum sp. MHG1-6]|uniref:RagB/SusD family nutrient uptake outer membrane protein n=1 Tax=Marinoscillum sp. MHG1-6 TaxID=2959627 RepID=UPI00215861A8|nr:RagB/SusD family nutrient uptake outer membrane protein [Marinoscillum sp. MHG1-6]